MSEKRDVLLIGSGISALTAAVLLGMKGKRVLVLEQHTKPGGYMHSFSRFGELFDTGAHYAGSLAPGEPFHTLLSYMGVFEEAMFPRLDEKAFDMLYFPKGKIAIPQGYDNVISELAAIFPNERSAIEGYFNRVRSAVTAFPTYHFGSQASEADLMAALDQSLRAVVESFTSDPALQSVFYAYCNLHGVKPGDVSFGFHAIVTDSLLRGAYGLNGGGDALTRKFVARIRELGGEVLTRKKVTALNVRDRQIHQVQTEDGEVFTADWVISSAHPKATFRLLDDRSAFTPAFTARIDSLEESLGIFGLYAVCKARPSLPPNRNHYFFSSDDPAAQFAVPRPEDKPPVVFVSSPKREWTDAETKFPLSLHAAGPYEWFADWRNEPYGRRSTPYKDRKTLWSGKILSAIADHEPDFPSLIAQSLTSTPLTNLHFNGSEQGSSYGLYHSMQNTGGRAIGPRTKILNLLLTGQNGLFPGLLGAATSALRTVGHIVGIKPILRELDALGGAR